MEGDIFFYDGGCYHFSNPIELREYLNNALRRGIAKLFESKHRFIKEIYYSFDLDDIPYDLIIPPTQKINKTIFKKNKPKKITKESVKDYVERNRRYFSNQFDEIASSFSQGISSSTLIRLTENRFSQNTLRLIADNTETIFDDITAKNICSKISTPFIRQLLKSPSDNITLLHKISMNCYKKYGGHILTFLLSLPPLKFGSSESKLLKTYQNTEGRIPSFKFTYPNNSDNYIIWFYEIKTRLTANQKVAFIVNKTKKRILGHLNYQGYLESRVAKEKGQLQLFIDLVNEKLLYCEVELGRCINCNKELTDSRSLRVGYGKDCAEEYGIEY